MRRLLLPWDYGDEMIAKIIMASEGDIIKQKEKWVKSGSVTGKDKKRKTTAGSDKTMTNNALVPPILNASPKGLWAPHLSWHPVHSSGYPCEPNRSLRSYRKVLRHLSMSGRTYYFLV